MQPQSREIDSKKIMPTVKAYTDFGFGCSINGGHIMTVTGINEYGIIVDSWGQRLFVSYKDMIEIKGFTTIEIADIVD